MTRTEGIKTCAFADNTKEDIMDSHYMTRTEGIKTNCISLCVGKDIILTLHDPNRGD